MVQMHMGDVVLGISGASGAIYGVRLAEALHAAGRTLRIVASDLARLTMQHECSDSPEALAERCDAVLESFGDIGAKSASGSAPIDAVVICPCSGTTLGKLAAGISDNLVARSAIVALKERRPLILVPRETPLATIHLRNMTTLSEMGALILPASPGFYTHPRTLMDAVDFIVARILDHLGVDHDLSQRWTGEELDD